MTDTKELKNWIAKTSGSPNYQRIEVDGKIIMNGRAGSPISWNNIYQSGISFYKKRVCDIGCFNGYFSFKAEEQGAKKVVGYDVCEKAKKVTARLKELKKSNVEFVQRMFGETPFFDTKFDIVMALNMMHHVRKKVGIKKYKKAIHEMFQNCSEAIFEVNPEDNDIIKEIGLEHNMIPVKTIKGHRHNRLVVYYVWWGGTKKIDIDDILSYAGREMKRPAEKFSDYFCRMRSKISDVLKWEIENYELYELVSEIDAEYIHEKRNQPLHDLCLKAYELMASLEPRNMIRRGDLRCVQDYLRILDCVNAISCDIKLPPIGLKEDNKLHQGHTRLKAYLWTGYKGKLEYLDKIEYMTRTKGRYHIL